MIDAAPTRPARGLFVLPVRLALFALFQATIAVILASSGTPDAWGASAAWWPVVATLANVVTIGLLASLARAEGRRLRDLYALGRQGRGDVLPLVTVLIVAGGLGALGPYVLGTLLYGDPTVPEELFLRVLPRWAALVGVVTFPVTIALAELPLYFGYALPRLAVLWNGRAPAVVASALFLSLQHATLPLLPDPSFIIWRAFMFLPFALALGTALAVRHTLLPYLMVVHAILDMGVALRVLALSP